jgi:hypothetical protein
MQLLRYVGTSFSVVQQTAITYRSVAVSKQDVLLGRELAKS